MRWAILLFFKCNATYTITDTDIENGYYYTFYVINNRQGVVNSNVDIALYPYGIDITANLVRRVRAYFGKLSKEYTKEQNNVFFRNKLSGDITIKRDDFDFVTSKAFDTDFKFIVEYNVNNKLYNYFTGDFKITDCKLDYDNRSLRFTVDSVDKYSSIMAGLEKKYNLIKLNPDITSVAIQKRPLIQIYMKGDSSINCFLAGTFWEQSCNSIDSHISLRSTYSFACIACSMKIVVRGPGSPQACVGTYIGTADYNNGDPRLGALTLFKDGDIESPFKITGYTDSTYQFFRLYNGTTLLFSRLENMPQAGFLDDNLDDETFTWTLEAGGSGTMYADKYTYTLYSRYVLDVPTYNGQATSAIPANDITDDNLNYNRCIAVSFNTSIMSKEMSVSPTEYGVDENGLYYVMPAYTGSQKYFPISRNYWGYTSFWWAYPQFINVFESKGRSQFILNDCYRLSSCINVLLAQITTGITHYNTTAYSEFLYGEINPISGIQKFEYYITQKSNLLHGVNATPANKASVTLSAILEMLKTCFKCYWWVDGNKLKIEHIKYFRNGLSYSTPDESSNIEFDLTKLLDAKTGKYWGYDSSKIEYEKPDMPERFEFSWMDDVTPAFEGTPIEAISKYVTKGNIETVNVENFTTDIDYILANPGWHFRRWVCFNVCKL